ncbi:hypothetical protein DC082_09445 [Ignatzschineria indica]|uniref:Uncharacterized protein n=1 Tax=Ignatzschineria indica TaxID=472583 RepID=A0A2U2AI97_9GAMM|nr:hypothetical protein DC082_09445 [Ignatzschineria indica]
MYQPVGFQEIRVFIERREGTLILLSQLHARRLAFSMLIAGAKSEEVRGSKIRQCIGFWVFKIALLLRNNISDTVLIMEHKKRRESLLLR